MAQPFLQHNNYGDNFDRVSAELELIIPNISPSGVTSPTEGMLTINPSDNLFYYYNGSAWVTPTSSAGFIRTGIVSLASGTRTVVVPGCLTTDSVQVTLRLLGIPGGSLSVYSGIILSDGTVTLRGFIQTSPGVFTVNTSDNSSVNWAVLR